MPIALHIGYLVVVIRACFQTVFTTTGNVNPGNDERVAIGDGVRVRESHRYVVRQVDTG